MCECSTEIVRPGAGEATLVDGPGQVRRPPPSRKFQTGRTSVRCARGSTRGLTYATTRLETPHRLVRVAWRAEGDALVGLDVDVPDGVTACVRRRDGSTVDVGAGTHHLI